MNKKRFLETLTLLGNDVLIPIDRIKNVILCCENNHYKIKITCDDNCDYEECFSETSEDTACDRYEDIRSILD